MAARGHRSSDVGGRPQSSRQRKSSGAVWRDRDEVTKLELFFDLVFVVALTQCTTVITNGESWADVGRAMTVLGLLWWAWVGFAWVATIVDPSALTRVRIAMFIAMAAFLVAALAVPRAFDDDAGRLVIAYLALRITHLWLAWHASRGVPQLGRSLRSGAAGTAVGAALLCAGAFWPGPRELLWLCALALDAGGSFFFGASGWRLSPNHFAERHGLIVIVALGESVFAIGVGAGPRLSDTEMIGAVLGVFMAATLWWAYFDRTARVASDTLAAMSPGREQNELARDVYSYLHLPMVAGVVLVAAAVESTLAQVGEPLDLVPAASLGGGLALYLVALVAFKRRAVGTWHVPRALAAGAGVALVPVWHHVDALVALTSAFVLMATLIVLEAAIGRPAPAGTGR